MMRYDRSQLYIKNYYVVLVNYSNPHLTIDCIESLNKAGCENSRIVVVDNASPDDSVHILKQIHGIRLIISNVNGGFSYGNNLGIKWAVDNDCGGVILLNNDTIVAEDFFDHIFSGPENEVCVPKILYFSHPDTIWMAGLKYDYIKGRPVPYGANKKDSPEFSTDKYVDFACGCCMKIPRTVIDKCGLLDESFFMYKEDDDYSFRLKKDDIRIHYIASARIWHKVSQSAKDGSKFMIYYCTRNSFYIFDKYKVGIVPRLYTFINGFRKYIQSFFNGSNHRVFLKAWKDYKNGIVGKVDV